MSYSIFETMETIESKARLITEEYDQLIKQARLKSESELNQLLQDCQTHHQEIYDQMVKQLSMKKQVLEKEVEEKIRINDLTIQQISMNRKEEFVEKIVSRVVECYGH